MRPLLESRSQVAFPLRWSCSPADCGWTGGVQVVSRTSLGWWWVLGEGQRTRVSGFSSAVATSQKHFTHPVIRVSGLMVKLL